MAIVIESTIIFLVSQPRATPAHFHMSDIGSGSTAHPPFRAIQQDDSSTAASEAESDSEHSSDVRRLQRELAREKHKNAQLTSQLQRQTQLQGRLQLQAEQEEEYITNKLMKRLETLKQEKEELARQVEVEEEMITNALTKKLQKVKEEKVLLENQLEQEQEYIVNKLQKQLSAVLDEKRALESRLRENTGAILQSIQHHLARWKIDEAPKASSDGRPCASTAVEANAAPVAAELEPMPPAAALPPAAPCASSFAAPAAVDSEEAPPPQHPSEWATPGATSGAPASDVDEWQRTHLLVSHLTREIDQLGAQQERYRLECEQQRQGNEKLRVELSKLQADNAGLCRRVAREREIRVNAIVDRARLETELELETERAFNSGGCSSSALSSVTSSPALSASNSSLPPSWALTGSPGGSRGLTPSAYSSTSQLSPRAASPKHASTPTKGGVEGVLGESGGR